MKLHIPRSPWFRIGVMVAIAAIVGLLLWWRGPDWGAIPDAFQAVEWQWVAVAVGLNLLSIVARSIAWQIVIDQAMAPPGRGFHSSSPPSASGCWRTRSCPAGSASSRGWRC